MQTGAVVKRLSAVEIRRQISHQHELNGVRALQRLFGAGSGRKTFRAVFVRFRRDDTPLVSTGHVTWYNARERHPTRTEYRLYYSDDEVMPLAEPGDLLLIVRSVDDVIRLVLAEAGSDAEAHLQALIGHEAEVRARFVPPEELGGLARLAGVLDLDVAISEADVASVERDTRELVDRLLRSGQIDEGQFPAAAELSRIAREVCESDVDPREDPDNALLAWFTKEEEIFRELERRHLEQLIREDLNCPQEFLEHAKTYLNRRKARAGLALENHVAALLELWNIRFTRGERRREGRPDFVLRTKAGEFFLHVKTSCKERWRQILTEAPPGRRVGFLTLDPAIAASTLRRLREARVSLVIPEPLQGRLGRARRRAIRSVRDFLQEVTDP